MNPRNAATLAIPDDDQEPTYFYQLDIGDAFTIPNRLFPGTYIKLQDAYRRRYGWTNALGPARYQGDLGYRHFYDNQVVIPDQPDLPPQKPVPTIPVRDPTPWELCADNQCATCPFCTSNNNCMLETEADES